MINLLCAYIGSMLGITFAMWRYDELNLKMVGQIFIWPFLFLGSVVVYYFKKLKRKR